jgi:hypothetical protein
VFEISALTREGCEHLVKACTSTSSRSSKGQPSRSPPLEVDPRFAASDNQVRA